MDKKLALNGEITGMYMIDGEGTLETRDVSCSFVKGKPQAVKSIYVMKTAEDWDRFMRFMERYFPMIESSIRSLRCATL